MFDQIAARRVAASCVFMPFFHLFLFYTFVLLLLSQDNNKLEYLPIEIGNITSLKTLWLGKFICLRGAWYESIFMPWQIPHLPSYLIFLFFPENNKITHVPEEIGQLSNLEELYLSK